MPDDPPQLRMGSFAAHVARGIVRERRTRRAVMLATVIAAMALVFCGVTFLQSLLDPHEHPGWFIFYWFVCGWITVLALLLAFFDLLMVRREGRVSRENLHGRFSPPENRQ